LFLFFFSSMISVPKLGELYHLGNNLKFHLQSFNFKVFGYA
jgi:hypothetical protein